MNYNQKTLTNGLRTLFVDSSSSKASSVQVWFRAGSAMEDKSEYGIAHFLEHMFFKGTKKRPGFAIAKEVESFGGEVNAFTSFDYTCYYINCPSSHLPETLEILMDMISNPLFEEKELIPERNVVHEEFRRSLDSPNQVNFSKIQSSVFSPAYAHSILGTEKSILSFNREQLISFRERYYNLSNALLVVAGDTADQPALEKIINKFELPKGPASSFPKFKLKPKAAVNIHSKQVNESSLTMVIQAPDYLEKHAAAEDLVIHCLTLGDTSYLYDELVSKTNHASSVSGSTMFFNNKGAHFIKISFPSENFKKVLSTFEKVLKSLLDAPFNEKEITRIKNQYVASKIYERESVESFAFSLGHGFAQNGDIHCEDEFINNIKRTSVDEVNQAFKEIFLRSIHCVVQHPLEVDKKVFEKAIPAFRESVNKTISKSKIVTKSQKIESSRFDKEVQLIELKKGVRLLYRQNELTPTFSFQVYLKGGLSEETAADNGKYYLLSKILTNGYGKTSYFDLKRDLESRSSYLNGFSGKNAYGLSLYGLTENFDVLLEHFAGSLLSPKLPNHYIKLEKELIKRHIHVQKQDPVKACFKRVNQLLFNQHPYSMPISGSIDSLKKLNRKMLLELHQKALASSEILFTYCGDLDLPIVQGKLMAHLDSLSPRKVSKTKPKPYSPIHDIQESIPFDREQTQMFIGKSSYSILGADDLHLKILTTHLNGQSSELFVDVRDRRGLCYVVQPVHHSALEGGYWGIYIGTGKEKAAEAKKAILNILRKIQKKGLSESELKRIKRMISGQNEMSLQTNEDYANFYSVPVLHRLGLDFQNEVYERLDKVRAKDFNAFVKDFLKEDWVIIEAG